MSKATLLLTLLGVVVLLLGGAYVLSLGAKPSVELVEKVLPDDRFPR